MSNRRASMSDPDPVEEEKPLGGDKAQKSPAGNKGVQSAVPVDPSAAPVDPSAAPADGGTLPGIQAFASLGSVAPFMTLWQLYAANHYPDESEIVGKYHCFTGDHRWLVRACFLMDFLIRLVLVLLVLVVILRGLSLFPKSLDLYSMIGSSVNSVS